MARSNDDDMLMEDELAAAFLDDAPEEENTKNVAVDNVQKTKKSGKNLRISQVN